jgi:hypothetical protein
MKSLYDITPENFNEKFNIQDILSNSVFYPASGIDGRDIECLSRRYSSFVHVDYSTLRDVVENGMLGHFEGVGYRLIGMKDIQKNELTPANFRHQPLPLNAHEKDRLERNSFIRDHFNGNNFTPFALWAVYELNTPLNAQNQEKPRRFSLLHIGGEACATFEALYYNNKINPAAVSIISPGEGFGDNWTLFTHPEFRLYQTMLLNTAENGTKMPDILLTNMALNDNEICFWPDYTFNKSYFIDYYIREYVRNNND